MAWRSIGRTWIMTPRVRMDMRIERAVRRLTVFASDNIDIAVYLTRNMECAFYVSIAFYLDIVVRRNDLDRPGLVHIECRLPAY